MMRSWLTRVRAAGLVAVIASLSISGCKDPILPQPKAPEFAPKDQTKCSLTKSQARPLIVEWPSADRAALETQLRRGLVAVRYEGCEMEVLPQCRATSGYTYAGLTRKRDRVTMRDADELYANIPVYAAKFETMLEKRGELSVSMTIVGRYEAERFGVTAGDLMGDCAKATHVVAGLTVGAFEFFSGAESKLGGAVGVAGVGAGARSSSEHETINQDGDQNDCEKSTEEDKKPPPGCGALLRLEVTPIAEALAAAAPLPKAAVEAPAVVSPAPSAPAPVAPAGALFFDPFASASFKDRWTLAGGTGVITDGALALASDDDGWAHVILRQRLASPDYSLSVKARLTKGALVELMLHVDGARYVRLYLYKTGKGVYIGDGAIRDAAGGGSTVLSKEFSAKLNTWYQLVATAKGNHYSLSIDGNKVIEYEDEGGHFSRRGSVGLMVNGEAEFDDVVVTAPRD